jgi:hypothetical protein
LCLKFNLDGIRQSYREIALKKIYCLGHKHLALGDRVTEKKGSDSVVFKVVEGKLLCLKFNLEASCQSYWDISLGKNISV